MRKQIKKRFKKKERNFSNLIEARRIILELNYKSLFYFLNVLRWQKKLLHNILVKDQRARQKEKRIARTLSGIFSLIVGFLN